MEHIKEEQQFLEALVKGIAVQFGDKCEAVLHDLTGSYDRTIVAIENSHITGRRIGDCGSNLGLEVLRGTVTDGNRYNYVTQTKDGKMLRSTSVYIKNKSGETIGAVCINLDISDLIMAEKTLKSVTMHSLDHEVQEVFVQDVGELLDYLLQECQKAIGKPISYLTKEEKMRAVQFLDQRGAFLVKKRATAYASFWTFPSLRCTTTWKKRERSKAGQPRGNNSFCSPAAALQM
ncbi:helix-turn-helix transcriptional regulator [Gordoniibacillus kamchatkensis]|uniref:helix-turn-helix transcriptional regulator n=1 Tax=Gordoniibacillus kamchatkensis TaxID=1590651 RepID=UPI000AE87548